MKLLNAASLHLVGTSGALARGLGRLSRQTPEGEPDSQFEAMTIMAASNVPAMLDLATELGLECALDRAKRVKEKLLDGEGTMPSAAQAVVLLDELDNRFRDDLGRVIFGYIPKEKKEYFNDFSFGEDFDKKFKGLKVEVNSAGLCYAHGLNTACVFHLMRVMELGVHHFGKRLGVNLVVSHPGRRVVELSWQNILDAINPKLKQRPQNTAQQKRRFEEISAIKSHLEAVKDAWRNPTMHPRETYDSIQALNIIYHVRSFMNDLARF